MNKQLPKRFRQFTKDYPDPAAAYERLGQACHQAGPLEERGRALVKLGISIGARLEGAVHSHVRKALALGVHPDEVRHAALLSLPTIGLPSMMAAMSWIDDALPSSSRRRKRRSRPRR